jgi:hypothetical protein
MLLGIPGFMRDFSSKKFYSDTQFECGTQRLVHNSGGNHHNAISVLFPLPRGHSLQGLERIFITWGELMSSVHECYSGIYLHSDS